MLNVDFSSTMLIIISIVILILILACIVFIIYKDKKMDKNEINDLLDDLIDAKPRVNVNEFKQKKNDLEKTDSLINSKIEIPIGENLPNKVVKEEKVDLDSILNKMQANLDKQEDVVENFEMEQEEKSIISYHELIESMKKDNFKEDISKYENEQENLTKEQVKEFLIKKEEPKKEIIKDTESKFQNTDFISPVFGKMDANIEYPTVKLYEKEEKNYKHASNSNNEFLQSLKDFRSNL